VSKKDAQFGQQNEGSVPRVDMLDVALGSGEPLDDEAGSGVTVRVNDHVPALTTGDDEEAPSPDDLGRAFLSHATESEHSLSPDELIPDVNELPVVSAGLGEAGADSDEDGPEEDETTAEYIRRHRISLLG